MTYFKNFTNVWVTVHITDTRCKRGKRTESATEEEWRAEGWRMHDGDPYYFTRCRRCMVRLGRLMEAGAA